MGKKKEKKEANTDLETGAEVTAVDERKEAKKKKKREKEESKQIDGEAAALEPNDSSSKKKDKKAKKRKSDEGNEEGNDPGPDMRSEKKEKKKRKKSEKHTDDATDGNANGSERKKDEKQDGNDESVQDDGAVQERKKKKKEEKKRKRESTDSIPEAHADGADASAEPEGKRAKKARKKKHKEFDAAEQEQQPQEHEQNAPAAKEQHERNDSSMDSDKEPVHPVAPQQETAKESLQRSSRGHSQQQSSKDGNDEVAEGGTKVLVGNLAWSVEDQMLRNDFADCGEVVDAFIVRNKEDKTSKGYGFVAFKDTQSAQRALEYDGSDYSGRPLRISLARPRTEQGGDGAAGANKKGKQPNASAGDSVSTIFVKNLPKDKNEETVRNAVSEAFTNSVGDVNRVRLPSDKDAGTLKGFGFVDFSSEVDASAANAMDGSSICGSRVKVDVNANAGKQQQQSSGGAGSGGQPQKKGGTPAPAGKKIKL